MLGITNNFFIIYCYHLLSFQLAKAVKVYVGTH